MGVAHRYTIEKLRCALCNEVFTPELPDELKGEKYDANFIAQLALQKYFIGVPCLRQQTYQKILDFPLPHSTQWMLNEKLASTLIPIFNTLCQLTSNMSLIHIDDTSVKIVDEICSNRKNPDKKRKGMFTTGLMGVDEERKIGLFMSGLQHAGENLKDILSKRKTDDVVKIMSDALSRNASKVTNIVKCYCLSHAYRKFDELISFYEKPCLKITDYFSRIYKIDHETKEMTDSERLSHHQKHSQPILNDLHAYLNKLIDEKEVEPNDSLGQAIFYTLKHWHELTQFVRIEGVPLDNNELERSLKVAIRGRNNWLFYKTTYGAYIGSVITSVIYTCTLSNINPLDYLITVQENKNQIIKEPSAWLPWNYQAQLNKAQQLVA